jgi:hypothetical protein
MNGDQILVSRETGEVCRNIIFKAMANRGNRILVLSDKGG